MQICKNKKDYEHLLVLYNHKLFFSSSSNRSFAYLWILMNCTVCSPCNWSMCTLKGTLFWPTSSPSFSHWLCSNFRVTNATLLLNFIEILFRVLGECVYIYIYSQDNREWHLGFNVLIPRTPRLNETNF